MMEYSMYDTPILRLASEIFEARWNALAEGQGWALAFRRGQRHLKRQGKRLTGDDVNELRRLSEFDEDIVLQWLKVEKVSNVRELTNDQLTKLRKGIDIYARVLFRLSDGGKHLSPIILRESRRRMTLLHICSGYPC